jgi:hypothetical protein
MQVLTECITLETVCLLIAYSYFRFFFFFCQKLTELSRASESDRSGYKKNKAIPENAKKCGLEFIDFNYRKNERKFLFIFSFNHF